MAVRPGQTSKEIGPNRVPWGGEMRGRESENAALAEHPTPREASKTGLCSWVEEAQPGTTADKSKPHIKFREPRI